MDRVNGPSNLVMRLCDHARRNRECGCSGLCDEAIAEIKDCRAERDALKAIVKAMPATAEAAQNPEGIYAERDRLRALLVRARDALNQVRPRYESDGEVFQSLDGVAWAGADVLLADIDAAL